MVNCSKTTWVLATNAFDQTIHEFCDNHRDEVFGDPGTKNAEEKIRRLGRQLTRRIQKESISVFGVSELISTHSVAAPTAPPGFG
jgi:phage host-nuclease inhibitor protein Gam